MAKGDVCITPAKMPFFDRWEGDNHYLQIRIASDFIDRIAQEPLHKSDRLV